MAIKKKKINDKKISLRVCNKTTDVITVRYRVKLTQTVLEKKIDNHNRSVGARTVFTNKVCRRRRCIAMLLVVSEITN